MAQRAASWPFSDMRAVGARALMMGYCDYRGRALNRGSASHDELESIIGIPVQVVSDTLLGFIVFGVVLDGMGGKDDAAAWGYAFGSLGLACACGPLAVWLTNRKDGKT